VTDDARYGTAIVKLGMEYPEAAKDFAYKDMLQEVSKTLLETTQARGQFETLISGPQKGDIAVRKLRERIAANMDGILKAVHSKLENQYGPRGDKAKELAARQEKTRAPQAKVIEFKTKQRPAREQPQESGWDAKARG